jgi:hypothetical protein
LKRHLNESKYAMKRHTCVHDTEMTFQVHMNNCGQQPEKNKTREQQLLQVGAIGIR